ncbi:MAG: hypothetical protein AAF560_01450 [Acidobacteriota bacterium]
MSESRSPREAQSAHEVQPSDQAAPQVAPPPQPSTLVSLRWPLTLVALALIALAFYVVTLQQAERAVDSVGSMVSGAADRAEGIAQKFLSGNITETFVASIPEVDASGSGLLELATADVTETFTRSDERRAFWDLVPLGTTTTEIKVPVTYRYHLRLEDPWRLEVSGQTCVVYAPQIRPTQPPAIHTDRMEKRAEEGWLRFDATEQLDDLQRSITPRLTRRAGDPRHVELARETSRRTVAEFVRSWLLREDHWREDRFFAIKVVFPDESVETPEALDNITIQLDPG